MGKKMVILIAALSLAVMGMWWAALDNYRNAMERVGELQTKLDTAIGDVDAFKARMREGDRVIKAVRELELQVQVARREADEEFAESMRYFGNDRMDRLERLLEADLARRDKNSCRFSPSESFGGLSGAGGAEGFHKDAEDGAD